VAFHTFITVSADEEICDLSYPFSRSTFFYGIVQRVNHFDGFGLNNIEALFRAMELELNQKLN
jgi:4-hydroxyphenylpyruvate dioxygenase-like putative hemolysin